MVYDNCRNTIASFKNSGLEKFLTMLLQKNFELIEMKNRCSFSPEIVHDGGKFTPKNIVRS
jgi:hypothetical protein